MIAIIDYGMGNVASVQKALNFLKMESCITADQNVIEAASYIVLPGVGSFLQGMNNLRESGLDKILTEQVTVKKKKFLGVCLGMQLIAETSFEPYESQGLGWIKGKVVKFEDTAIRIPHMGWNTVKICNPTYFDEIQNNDFYFIHSYHFVPTMESVIAAKVSYGSDYVAAVQQDNIFATQFHPEKSQTAGLMLLKNFFSHA